MNHIPEERFSTRISGVQPSAIREIFKLLSMPGMISFAGGNPASSALPVPAVTEILNDVMAEKGTALLQYGVTEGYPPFRESLREYVKNRLNIKEDDVLVTTGSVQAMDLLCKAVLNPGDVVLVENPSFLGNIQCLRFNQARLVPVDSDEYGIIPESLEDRFYHYHPKMLYTIPTFQNPSGKTVPAERRREILRLAVKYDIIVAEDDPYYDLRYSGEPVPQIKTDDTYGYVIYLGSFSKIISPGMRVGYMVGHPDLIRRCIVAKQCSDLHTPNLTQAVVDQFLRRGLLPDHIKRINASYAEQLNIMLDELKSFPSGVKYTRPDGGLFIWVELPECIDTLKLLPQAAERSVAYVPGTHFYIEGGHLNTLRLNFSNSTPEQIRTGMGRLRELFSDAIAAGGRF